MNYVFSQGGAFNRVHRFHLGGRRGRHPDALETARSIPLWWRGKMGDREQARGYNNLLDVFYKLVADCDQFLKREPGLARSDESSICWSRDEPGRTITP